MHIIKKVPGHPYILMVPGFSLLLDTKTLLLEYNAFIVISSLS